MIKLATIGTSWITEAFLLGCGLLKNEFQLTAVYSRNYEKGLEFGKNFGCERVVCDLQKLATDPEIEAVYIASPNAFHYSQSKLMLQNKKHVLCEKPITVTPQELEELQTLAKLNNVVYMEAIMGPHLPAWATVIDKISSLGRISHARFDFSQRSSKLDALFRGEHQNIFDPKMAAGALMDLGVYCVYPAVYWFGEPKDVYSYCRFLNTGADGEGGAILHYNDLNVELTWSKTGESRLGSEIVGENGTIVMPSISTLRNAQFIAKDGSVEPLFHNPEKPELMSYETANFYRYITDIHSRDELEALNEIALSVSRLMQTIRRQCNINFNVK